MRISNWSSDLCSSYLSSNALFVICYLTNIGIEGRHKRCFNMLLICDLAEGQGDDQDFQGSRWRGFRRHDHRRLRLLARSCQGTGPGSTARRSRRSRNHSPRRRRPPSAHPPPATSPSHPPPPPPPPPSST